MLRQGTTLVECKSGYGLDTESEMKLLKASITFLCIFLTLIAFNTLLLQILHKAKACTPIEIVANYLGAHSVPKGLTAEEATEDILNNQIPVLKVICTLTLIIRTLFIKNVSIILKELKEKGEISPEFIDVFLEKGVYDREQTRYFTMANRRGLIFCFFFTHAAFSF